MSSSPIVRVKFCGWSSKDVMNGRVKLQAEWGMSWKKLVSLGNPIYLLHLRTNHLQNRLCIRIKLRATKDCVPRYWKSYMILSAAIVFPWCVIMYKLLELIHTTSIPLPIFTTLRDGARYYLPSCGPQQCCFPCHQTKWPLQAIIVKCIWTSEWSWQSPWLHLGKSAKNRSRDAVFLLFRVT